MLNSAINDAIASMLKLHGRMLLAGVTSTDTMRLH
jgi:hypothetical protein